MTLSSSDDLRGAVFGESLGQAETYARILAIEGLEWGLLGPREASRIWSRHIINSVCLIPLIKPHASVIDVGSGAGLPGVPLALARPDLSLVLVEPMLRRCEFLEMVVSRLSLGDRVRVVRSRVEEYSGSADVVTCRALASVSSLARMVTTRSLKWTQVLAIKGERASEEISTASETLSRHKLKAQVLHPLVMGESLGTVVRLTRR